MIIIILIYKLPYLPLLEKRGGKALNVFESPFFANQFERTTVSCFKTLDANRKYFSSNPKIEKDGKKISR